MSSLVLPQYRLIFSRLCADRRAKQLDLFSSYKFLGDLIGGGYAAESFLV
jgi:hypothetical protein